MTAGEGTRTLDIQLGKLALYQLSYARESPECSTANVPASRIGRAACVESGGRGTSGRGRGTR